MTHHPRQHRLAAACVLATIDRVRDVTHPHDDDDDRAIAALAADTFDPVAAILADADRDELLGVIRGLIPHAVLGSDPAVLRMIIESMARIEAENP